MRIELKDYYRNIRRCLPCSRKLRQQIADSIQTQVNTYLEERPETDFASVQQHFGTPEQIVAAYIDEMTTTELQKKFKHKQKVIVIICIAVALALIMWATMLVSAWVDAQKSFDGFYDVGNIIESDVEEYK